LDNQSTAISDSPKENENQEKLNKICGLSQSIIIPQGKKEIPTMDIEENDEKIRIDGTITEEEEEEEEEKNKQKERVKTSDTASTEENKQEGTELRTSSRTPKANPIFARDFYVGGQREYERLGKKIGKSGAGKISQNKRSPILRMN